VIDCFRPVWFHTGKYSSGYQKPFKKDNLFFEGIKKYFKSINELNNGLSNNPESFTG